MSEEVGGYRCPAPGCGYRAVVPGLIEQHLKREHPEEEQ